MNPNLPQELYNERIGKPQIYSSEIPNLPKGQKLQIIKDEKPKKPKLLYQFVGVLRSSWFSASKQLITYTYGSAFMVSRNIIITATHNCYSAKRQCFAQSIEFLPGVQKGKVSQIGQGKIRNSFNNPKNKNKVVNLLHFENFFSHHDFNLSEVGDRLNFEYRPKMEEITLIALDPLQIPPNLKGEPEGIPIGTLPESRLNSKTELAIVGYPSAGYNNVSKIRAASLKRKELAGHLISVERVTAVSQNKNGEVVERHRFEAFNYTMETSHGISGSPVLALDENGEYFAVGIHTHKGQKQGQNSGVYFDRSFLHAIKVFEQRIMQRLLDYSKENDLPSEVIKTMPIKVVELEHMEEGLKREELLVTFEKAVSDDGSEQYSGQSSMKDYDVEGSVSSDGSLMSDLGMSDFFTLACDGSKGSDEEPAHQGCTHKLIVAHPQFIIDDGIEGETVRRGRN